MDGPSGVTRGAGDEPRSKLEGEEIEDAFERAADLLASAERLVVLTGAGVSAESGIPTFRGTQGLWKSRRPEELATPEAFARDPRLVWEWYAWRRELVAGCAPNPAHAALARLSLGHPSATLVTQNVDGLHHRAAEEAAGPGEDAARGYPLEVHGALHRDRCSGCDARTPGRADVDSTGLDTLPRCDDCGELLRPDVVWFGESLDPDTIAAAFEAAREADACLVVGTSAVVHPAAAVPDVTLRGGGSVIEVNPAPTPLTPRAAAVLRGAAGEVLPRLLSGLAPD